MVWDYEFNYRGQNAGDKKGLGTNIPHDLKEGDDEFDAYRKRMMMAYRFRPNPLVSFHFLFVSLSFNAITLQLKKTILCRTIHEGHITKLFHTI